MTQNGGTYLYETRGRNPRTALALAAVVLVLIGLNAIGTVFWIMFGVALFAVPAAMDMLFDLRTEFTLDETAIKWRNRTQEAEIPLHEIDKVRLDGRFDLSVRITVILRDQSKVRIPHDVQPPHKVLESELKKRDVTTARHPFTLF